MRLARESVKYLEFLVRRAQRAESISCLHGFPVWTPAESIRVLYRLYSDRTSVTTDRKGPFIYNFAFRCVRIVYPKPAWDSLVFGMDGAGKKTTVAVACSIVESHIRGMMFG